MDHPFFTHRRTLVAASIAALVLLVFAPKSYGKIPQTGSTAVREQSAPSGPVPTGVRPLDPPTTRPAPDRQREAIPETDAHDTKVDTPSASDWSDELALGTGLLAAFVLAGGMTLVLRHRRTVSTIR